MRNESLITPSTKYVNPDFKRLLADSLIESYVSLGNTTYLAEIVMGRKVYKTSEFSCRTADNYIFLDSTPRSLRRNEQELKTENALASIPVGKNSKSFSPYEVAENRFEKMCKGLGPKGYNLEFIVHSQMETDIVNNNAFFQRIEIKRSLLKEALISNMDRLACRENIENLFKSCELSNTTFLFKSKEYKYADLVFSIWAITGRSPSRPVEKNFVESFESIHTARQICSIYYSKEVIKNFAKYYESNFATKLLADQGNNLFGFCQIL